MPNTAAANTGSTSRTFSLSPSRAKDFLQCPLLYRFRSVDRLPEPPSAAAARGTLVHTVLERIFDVPAAARTLAHARSLIGPSWEQLLASEPEVATLFADEAALTSWLQSAEQLVDRWFEVENPTRLEPAEREVLVETELPTGLRLRGYIDRLDVAPNSGALRVVDYKTGRSPRPQFEAEAMFQMRFYALVLWRSRGVIPTMLQLVFLGDGAVLRYEPTEAQLLATERKILAIWEAIEQAARSGNWLPTRSKLCDWCNFKPLCPTWGGTAPEPPANAVELVLGPQRA